jgi:hypothetical protein
VQQLAYRGGVAITVGIGSQATSPCPMLAMQPAPLPGREGARMGPAAPALGRVCRALVPREAAIPFRALLGPAAAPRVPVIAGCQPQICGPTDSQSASRTRLNRPNILFIDNKPAELQTPQLNNKRTITLIRQDVGISSGRSRCPRTPRSKQCPCGSLIVLNNWIHHVRHNSSSLGLRLDAHP